MMISHFQCSTLSAQRERKKWLMCCSLAHCIKELFNRELMGWQKFNLIQWIILVLSGVINRWGNFVGAFSTNFIQPKNLIKWLNDYYYWSGKGIITNGKSFILPHALFWTDIHGKSIILLIISILWNWCINSTEELFSVRQMGFINFENVLRKNGFKD